MSTPCSKGLVINGVEKVLSATKSEPLSCTIFAIEDIS